MISPVSLAALLLILLVAFQTAWALPNEESFLILRNGGREVGIMPQIGGRVVLFRIESGKNVIDSRPDQWNHAALADPWGELWQQYYGDSVWAGPQTDWWTTREPYPPQINPKREWPGAWPPDPAWEVAPYVVTEETVSRVVMKSPISKLTGLELTKTIDLLPDGRLVYQVSAINRGDRPVTRDLWLLLRVPPEAHCFLPLKTETAEAGFTKAALLQKIEGLTELEPAPHLSNVPAVTGKMSGVASAGWMAAVTPDSILTIEFPLVDESHVAPGQAPVEVFRSSAPTPICEMEQHREIKTLAPGETMQCEETWRIFPNPGFKSAEAQAHYLRTKVFPESGAR